MMALSRRARLRRRRGPQTEAGSLRHPEPRGGLEGARPLGFAKRLVALRAGEGGGGSVSTGEGGGPSLRLPGATLSKTVRKAKSGSSQPPAQGPPHLLSPDPRPRIRAISLSLPDSRAEWEQIEDNDMCSLCEHGRF